MKQRFLTIGVIRSTYRLFGTGEIGTLTGKKAMAAFSMKVIAYDSFLPLERRTKGFIYVDSIKELAAQSDYLSVHVPSTELTYYMINMQVFLNMKHSTFVINTSRGDILDERDLQHALEQKIIAGAGLDVFDPEPPSPDNPLLQMDNVVALPHNAALTVEAADRMGMHAAQGIMEILV